MVGFLVLGQMQTEAALGQRRGSGGENCEKIVPRGFQYPHIPFCFSSYIVDSLLVITL